MSDKNQEKGLCVAGFVLGIISCLGSVTAFGLIGITCGILGLVFSIKQRKKYPTKLATAGFVLSIIGLSISALLLIFSIFKIINEGI